MRSNTRKRPVESGSQENGHASSEPKGSSVDVEEGGDVKKPPSKKRKLEDSPPWKSATTQTPTSFIADGRRKSGRTNPIPLELQPHVKNGNGATPTRPTRFSQRQSGKKKDVEPTPAPRSTNSRTNGTTSTSHRKSNSNNRALQATPTPKPSHRRASKPTPPSKPVATKTTPIKTPELSKIDLSPKIEKTSPAKTTPAKAIPAKPIATPKPSAAIGIRKSARTASKSAAADEEPDQSIGVKEQIPLATAVPFIFDSEGEIEVEPDFKLPKLKLKFSVPKPVITHPSHILPKQEFPSFEDFLNSEDPTRNEIFLTAAESEARDEAGIRVRIENAVVNGLLAPENCSLNLPEKQPEPPRQYSHYDHLMAQALHFQKLLFRERRDHTEIMKKRNAAVMAEIKRRRPRTKEELEQEQIAEYRKNYKDQVSQVRRKWEEVMKAVEQIRMLRAEEEHRLAGKAHLNQMLEHSTQLLEARRGDRNASIATPSEGDLEAGSEDDDEEEEEGENSMDDKDDDNDDNEPEASDEANMSENESESEDAGDDDENLTVEELRVKYAGLAGRPTTGGKGTISTKISAAIDGIEMDETLTIDTETLAKLENPSNEDDSDVDMGEGAPEQTAEANVDDDQAGELSDAPVDDSDESVDMDSEDYSEDGEEDDSEDDEEDDRNALGSGLLGFFGKGDVTAEDENIDDDSENDFEKNGAHEDEAEYGTVDAMQISSEKPKNLANSTAEDRNTKYEGDTQAADEPGMNGRIVELEDDEITPKADGAGENSATNGHTDHMDIDTTTSVSQADAKDIGHPSSLTTPSETSPQPNAGVKTAIPFLLRGTLREYQHYGLDWLAGLYGNKTNGILADEMGLGKTIQTIALLAHLACEKEVWGPHLIIVPTSVMLNWEMEFKKWAPGFKILTYYGTKEQRLEKRKGWFDNNLWHVCITSYQLVLQDQVTFKRRNWHYLILDEAHNIKNFRSQRWQTLLNFKAEARLLITGTPLQNNLIELWSLLYFLMPSGSSAAMPAGFANLKEFQEWFAHPVDQLIEGGREGMDDEAKRTVTKLHRVLRPYLLRRLKADVEKQMPAKYEHIIYCRLSKRQRYLYDEFMAMAQTRETLASGNYLSIINCLMQLRKVCNHPDLFETRQIVTSFATQKSVVADYEIKELLVRRRFLQEDHFKPLLSTGFLEFVGLVPAKKNHLSTQHTREISRLSATKFLQQYYNEQAASIVPAEQDFSSIQGNVAFMQYQSQMSHLEKLKSCIRLNQLRTAYEPLYGSNLIEVCTGGVAIGHLKPPPRRREHITASFLEQSKIIQQMIPTLEERTESLQTIIDKFACVTPAVVATDMAPIALTKQGVETVRQAQRVCPSDPFHQARIRLSIAFPDKRLLQYDCGKLQRLDKLLRDLQTGGHRALIFTQMTKVLDILEQFLNIHGHRYLRLDGATKVEQRQILTDRFNNDPRILVFILSTRSGGLGINLTGADTVIFYDLDWNPAMDKQCQDRCHRIGQTRDVHIYRFVSEYTIESNILRKSNQKRMLDDVVIQEGDFTTDYFNKLTIRDMLGDEIAKDLAVDETKPVIPGGNMEKALEAAEDDEDAAAAKVAQREVVDADGADFAERQTPQTPKEKDIVVVTSTDPSAAATTTTTTPKEPTVDEDLNKGLRHDIYGIGWNRVDRDPELVDDFMIRFLEWELADVPVVLPDKSKKKKSKKGKKF